MSAKGGWQHPTITIYIRLERYMKAKSVINSKQELEFAVFCIEGVAAALGKPSGAVYRALAGDGGILSQYIVPSYDVLHTQGKSYIVNDICEVMAARGVAI